MTNRTDNSQAAGKRHTAGLLDIRSIIGLLLAIYGVILVLMGLFGDKELDKTGDVNANLWAGLGLLVAGVAFLAWARIRPIVVPEHVHDPSKDDTRPEGTPPPAH